ncbi:putative membrane protein [Bartonella apihabitans]|nr:putative membrane protein [Bartonella apihabitans]
MAVLKISDIDKFYETTQNTNEVQKNSGQDQIKPKVPEMLLKKTRIILFGMAIMLALSCAARADFRVCNTTQEAIGVSIGYRAKAGWMSEGWWVVGPTRCKTIIDGPLSSRFYYLHAEDAKNHGRWDGPINMCVKDSEFTINGVNDCFARGFQKAGFQEIDTGTQTSWMVQLTEPVSNNPALNTPLVTGAPTK